MATNGPISYHNEIEVWEKLFFVVLKAKVGVAFLEEDEDVVQITLDQKLITSFNAISKSPLQIREKFGYELTASIVSLESPNLPVRPPAIIGDYMENHGNIRFNKKDFIIYLRKIFPEGFILLKDNIDHAMIICLPELSNATVLLTQNETSHKLKLTDNLVSPLVLLEPGGFEYGGKEFTYSPREISPVLQRNIDSISSSSAYVPDFERGSSRGRNNKTAESAKKKGDCVII